jgi:hypothetical protein
LEQNGIPLHMVLEPPKVYASILWAVPSILAIYLAKPFIETILKKAAEDSYPAIRSAFQKLAKSVFRTSATLPEPRISLLLALYFERQNGGWVKALVWEGISADIQEEALDKLFVLVREENSGVLSSEQLMMWGALERWGTVFICFDLVTRAWKPIDIIEESRKSKTLPDFRPGTPNPLTSVEPPD